MHKEPACVSEAKDLFNSYAEKVYAGSINAAEKPKSLGTDLEASIQSELSDMQRPTTPAIFQNIKIDTRCIVFVRTQKPIEPVSFVKQICQEALDDSNGKRTRYIKRMTPMTMMGKATESGLETVAKHVLGPHFHVEGAPSRKFAIRPTIREHSDLKRDDVIKNTARLVGPKHSVDLKQYDLLILVEIYRNVLGMSVVGNDYEKLKRYNLAELYAPTSSTQVAALPNIVRPSGQSVAT